MALIDFRIQPGFFRHHKTKALRDACGEHAVLCLLELWAYAAENAPDGNLDALSDASIERQAGWEGSAYEKGKFVAQLRDKESLFLDGENGKQLHDWQEHQPFLASKKKRSAYAKHAARMRWACRSDAEIKKGNAPLPLPSPLPSPSPEILAAKPNAAHQSIIDYFCQEYQTRTGVPYAFQGGKDGKLIKAMLRTWTEDQMQKLIRQLFKTTDDFIAKTDRGVSVLSACQNKLAQECRESAKLQLEADAWQKQLAANHPP